MSNVVNLIPALNPDEVLKQADGVYSEVVIIGYDKDGIFDLRSGGKANIAEVAFMLQTAIHKIMNGDYQDE
jgi:hypothetical protein